MGLILGGELLAASATSLSAVAALTGKAVRCDTFQVLPSVRMSVLSPKLLTYAESLGIPLVTFPFNSIQFY